MKTPGAFSLRLSVFLRASALSLFLALLLTLALAWALGLSGCLSNADDTRRAGGEDFPNTLEPLGKAAAGQIAAQGDWNEVDNVPDHIAGLSEVDSVLADEAEALPAHFPNPPGISGSPALGKSAWTSKPALAAALPVWDYSDTALGLVRGVISISGPGALQEKDTLVYRYDEAFRQGRESEYLLLGRRGLQSRLGFLKTWAFAQTDGAGPLDEGFVTLLFTVGQVFRLHEIEVWPDSAGNPQSLSLSNRVWKSYAYKRGRGQDTLERLTLVDDDGDDSLWAGDRGFVRWVHSVEEPPLRPALLRVNTLARGVLSPSQGEVKTRYYREKREERDGKSITLVVKGRSGDSLFEPGDTISVIRQVDYDSTSALKAREDAFTVALAPGTDGKADRNGHRLLRFTAHWTWREGPLSESLLRFQPASPASSQVLRAQGSLQMTVTFEQGHVGEVEGDYSEDKMKVRYLENRQGLIRRFRVIWDRLGNLLERAFEAS